MVSTAVLCPTTSGHRTIDKELPVNKSADELSFIGAFQIKSNIQMLSKKRKKSLLGKTSWEDFLERQKDYIEEPTPA